MKRFQRPRTERGATAVEYGLLVALVAGVIVAILTTIGTQMLGIFANATTWPWN